MSLIGVAFLFLYQYNTLKGAKNAKIKKSFLFYTGA